MVSAHMHITTRPSSYKINQKHFCLWRVGSIYPGINWARIIYMNRCWIRGDFWWTSNFSMHQKVSPKKYDIRLILFVFFLIISKKTLFQSFSDSFS